MNEVTAAPAVPFLFFSSTLSFVHFFLSFFYIFGFFSLSLSLSLSLCSFPSSSSSCSSCSSLIFKPSNPFVGGVVGGSNTNNERHRQAGGRTDGWCGVGGGGGSDGGVDLRLGNGLSFFAVVVCCRGDGVSVRGGGGGCVIVGSVRLVVVGSTNREGVEVGYVGIASSTRRRSASLWVSYSLIYSHPTSWSFPKRSQTTKEEEKKEKKERDSHIHSRPIKKGAHFQNHYDIALYYSAVTRPAVLLLLLLLHFIPLFFSSSIFASLETNILAAWDIVRIFMASTFHFFFSIFFFSVECVTV